MAGVIREPVPTIQSKWRAVSKMRQSKAFNETYQYLPDWHVRGPIQRGVAGTNITFLKESLKGELQVDCEELF